MDVLGLTSEITSFLGSTASVGGLIFLACLGWITWSTRSGYVLRKLIWRIIHGKSEVLDIKIKEFADRQDSLMNFRNLSGLTQIRTLQHAQRVEQWMTDNDEGPSTLRKLGSAFDYDEIKPKADQTKALGVSVGVHLFLVVCLALASGSLSDFFRGDGAVVTIIKTDNTYAVSKEAAQPRKWRWTASGERSVDLTVKMCGKEPLPNVAHDLQWPLSDVQVLCELMTDSRSAAYVHDTVRGQRVLVGCFAALVIVAFFLSFKSMYRLKEYQDLEKRQLRRLKEKEKTKDLKSNAAADPNLKD
jgi:hypothetical protein